ncbi:LAFA_0A03730g1_1 [Lachancea sp. 'fantastica']|nr:LAFA_0A03730g1_1 [Lachancea sp. 'fantastica']
MAGKEQLLEDPVDLIRETRNNFSLVNDAESLLNVTQMIDELQRLVHEKVETKAEEVKKVDSAARKTENRLEVLRQTQLASNTDGNGSSSQNDAGQLAQELEELEKRLVVMRTEVDEGLKELAHDSSHELDLELLQEAVPTDRIHKANILKIQVFRSLGLVLDLPHRKVLLNKAGALDVVDLDDSTSEFYRTKYLWERM